MATGAPCRGLHCLSTDLSSSLAAVATFAFTPTGERVVSLSQGSRAPHGFWYAVQLVGFDARSEVVVTRHDSVDCEGPYSQMLLSAQMGRHRTRRSATQLMAQTIGSP